MHWLAADAFYFGSEAVCIGIAIGKMEQDYLADLCHVGGADNALACLKLHVGVHEPFAH